MLGRSKYHRRYEPIWYGWHDTGKSSFVRRPPRPGRRVGDPAPEALGRAPDDEAGRAGGPRDRATVRAPATIVLDPFGGSGSTLIAAEQPGRRCYAMEIDPLYCDVIVQRYEAFTGKKAERQSAKEAA